MTATASSPKPLFKLNKSSSIHEYLQANEAWAKDVVSKDVLSSNALGQQPHTLWIGCADSRCSEFSISGLQPGEIFTHRNIANILDNKNDVSSKAIINFAVNSLKVNKILICGHTKCGGVAATLQVCKHADAGISQQLLDWLDPLISLKFENEEEINSLASEDEKNRRLVELNVKKQVNYLISHDEDVKKAIAEKRLAVYGVIYNVDTGLLELVK